MILTDCFNLTVGHETCCYGSKKVSILTIADFTVTILGSLVVGQMKVERKLFPQMTGFLRIQNNYFSQKKNIYIQTSPVNIQ